MVFFCWIHIHIHVHPIVQCRQPRGFGFVQFVDPDDAADAKYHMDGQVLLGRELTVVFAEENRKKPSEMRSRERIRLVDFPISRLSIHDLHPDFT